MSKRTLLDIGVILFVAIYVAYRHGIGEGIFITIPFILLFLLRYIGYKWNKASRKMAIRLEEEEI